jgi:hypothetical protein
VSSIYQKRRRTNSRVELGEDDFEMEEGSDDDGEKWGGARILKVMKEEGVIDAVVVVSRW